MEGLDSQHIAGVVATLKDEVRWLGRRDRSNHVDVRAGVDDVDPVVHLLHRQASVIPQRGIHHDRRRPVGWDSVPTRHASRDGI